MKACSKASSRFSRLAHGGKMKLARKTIMMHGGAELYVLSPAEPITNVTSGHDNKGFAAIFGNGSGYAFLTQFFAAAADLRKNEILYLDTKYFRNDGFEETFSEIEYNYAIVCTNYCETQVSPKEIEKALATKIYTEQIIDRTPTADLHYLDAWKTRRRLTVKLHKEILFLSTNRDGFISLAMGASNLAKCGDKYYDFMPHYHFDWDENTSASVGVTLYHWHSSSEMTKG